MSTSINSIKPRANRNLLTLVVSLAIVIALLFISTIAVTENAKAVDVDNAGWDVAAMGGGVALIAAGAAFDGPGLVIAGSFLAAWGLYDLLSTDSGANQGDQLRDWYSQELYNNTKQNIEWSMVNANNTGELYTTDALYLARLAQYQAYQLYQEQTQEGLPHIYNPNQVFSYSDSSNASLAWLGSTYANYNYGLSQLDQIATTFTGDMENMQWGVGTRFYTSTYFPMVCTSGQIGAIRATNHIDFSVENSKAIFSNKVPIYVANYGGAVSESYIIVKDYTNTVVSNITLNDMANKEVRTFTLADLGLTSGVYSFKCSDADYNIFSVATQAILNSAIVKPGFIIFKNVDNIPTFCMGYYDGKVVNPSAGLPTAPDEFVIGFNSDWTLSTLSDFENSYNLGNLISNMNTMYDKVKTATVTANNAAQTYYQALVQTGGSDLIPFVDVLWPDFSQMENLSPEAFYALYLAYLNQLEGFLNTTEVIPPYVNITTESFNLLVRGQIYDNLGNMVANNLTIFTPYSMLDNMTLHLGLNNITTTGFYVVWGSGSTIQNCNNNNISYHKFVPGYQFNIEEMYYDNETVDTVTLNVTRWNFTVMEGDTNPTPPPQFPGGLSINDLVLITIGGIVMFIVGAIIAVASQRFAFLGKIIMVIGILMLVGVGILYLYNWFVDWFYGWWPFNMGGN